MYPPNEMYYICNYYRLLSKIMSTFVGYFIRYKKPVYMIKLINNLLNLEFSPEIYLYQK